jgi:hypothetical protein
MLHSCTINVDQLTQFLQGTIADLLRNVWRRFVLRLQKDNPRKDFALEDV